MRRLAGLILALSLGFPAGLALAHQPRQGASAHRTHPGTHPAHVKRHPPRNASERDRARFDHAGTRGRQGLGANPMRPEGPGRAGFR